MRTVVLEKNADGNIVLTVDEIKKMLNDAYEDGYQDWKRAGSYVGITYPSTPITWDKWTLTCKND